jgi:peptidoglycan/xylan/chitin deacetylase (PgdA/CDA1 family)
MRTVTFPALTAMRTTLSAISYNKPHSFHALPNNNQQEKKETEKNMSTRLLELGNRLGAHTYSWRDLDAR